MAAAVSGDIALPIAAFIVSVTTLLLAGVGYRRKASSDYVDQLENRLRVAEDELKDHRGRLRACENERRRLADQNLDLMRQLFKQDPST